MTGISNDPAHVREQYADESNLTTRGAVWRPGPDGRDPAELALTRLLEALPPGRAMPDVLEVGCGTGSFAARVHAEHPGIAYLATDQSQRFVELTLERGVPARLADVEDLLFEDASYDVVLALWMLYHVPDLDRGLAEIARVLRPGGTLIAVTNGDEHVADLRREAGGEALVTSFSSENAEASLGRHFAAVQREDVSTRARFADRDAALAYLRSTGEDVDWSLPAFDGPHEYAGHVTVFTARKAPE